MKFPRTPHLVVIAGGSGTRFWPKSTSKKPKQLLQFGSGESLICQTMKRFDGLVSPSHRWVATTRSLEHAIREQVGTQVKILAEPQGRNTAPCVYWAAREIANQDPEAVMLVMAADHWIPRVGAFQSTIEKAIALACEGNHLITLGVKPTRPETGYGYLRTGASIGDSCLKVDAFVEKPDLAKAKSYVADGKHLWNGGMFLWRVSAILKAFDDYMPEMKKAWDEVAESGQTESSIQGAQKNSAVDIDAIYPRLTATSIDYGIMEKSNAVVTFPLDCGWDDVGSWVSLDNLAQQLGCEHEAGVLLSGECIPIESKDCIVDVPDRVVTLLGVSDLIVVETGGALMIARKDRAQDIRKVVDAVKAKRPDLV